MSELEGCHRPIHLCGPEWITSTVFHRLQWYAGQIFTVPWGSVIIKLVISWLYIISLLCCQHLVDQVTTVPSKNFRGPRWHSQTVHAVVIQLCGGQEVSRLWTFFFQFLLNYFCYFSAEQSNAPQKCLPVEAVRGCSQSSSFLKLNCFYTLFRLYVIVSIFNSGIIYEKPHQSDAVLIWLKGFVPLYFPDQ